MKQHYKARCHCRNVRFSFFSEPFTQGKRCNCSICRRKGAVMSAHYIKPEDFEPIADLSVCTDYRWNDKMVNHLFCKTCGIYPYHGDASFGYRVNLGCVEGLDVLGLEIIVFDGASMPLAGDAETVE